MNLITNFFKDLTKDNITNGFIAFLFAVTGPVAIMLLVGTKTQLTNQELSSWLFGAFAINSIISIVFTFWYKQPLVFMWSIPGIILIGSSIENYSFNEIIGAYLVTGILLIFLGFTSILVWINKKIPIEIKILDTGKSTYSHGGISGDFFKILSPEIQGYREFESVSGVEQHRWDIVSNKLNVKIIKELFGIVNFQKPYVFIKNHYFQNLFPFFIFLDLWACKTRMFSFLR